MAKHPPLAKPAPFTAPDAKRAAPSRRAYAPRIPLPVKEARKGDGRVLSPEEIKKAAAEGRKIVAYSPEQIAQFLTGQRTLGELQGISKAEQYQMAEVGYRFLTSGKLADAKDVFFGLVALDPFDAYFLTCLGSAHQQAGESAEAERFYTRALEINPYNATARTHRGELRAMSGRLVEAVDDLARVLKDDVTAKDPATPRAAVLLRTIQTQLQ